MLTTILFMLGGLIFLVGGAEWFVRGAAGIADRLGVSPMVIGLTVVAYGTSMPELVVSAVAGLEGSSEIALGNVVGSNIANIGLILGLTALLAPPAVDASLIKREMPVLMAASLALPVVLWNDVIGRVEGIALLIGAVAFTVMTVRTARHAPSTDTLAQEATAAATDEAPPSGSLMVLIGLTVVGLLGMLLGGRFFVDNAVTLAAAIGVSERVIGLTIVAVGTSLPELAASAVAALRGHSSLAVGNVVGSNIFNVLFVMGAASVLTPVRVRMSTITTDLVIMMAFTVLLVWVLRGERKLSRIEGIVMLVAYGLALVWLA